MDQTAYQAWWQLHVRTARGDLLAPAEQASYDEGLRLLHVDEQLREATSAREAREALITLQAEHGRWEERRRQLDAEIAQLEARLSEPTRQFLGVGG